MAKLEFFFDCSSPWTYLAFTRIQDVIARTNAETTWKPILVGGVFNEVNRDVYERRAHPDPRRASYSEKDLQDWARLAGIKIGKPPVFPVRAVAMMRCAVAADEEGALISFSRAASSSASTDGSTCDASTRVTSQGRQHSGTQRAEPGRRSTASS